MTQQIHILNVRLPDDTIAWIDQLVKAGVYNSRSEAIRDFLRDYMKEAQR
jgi:Arc/MetJ-type ribon-helix-helix transcriptional regulator